MENSGKSKGKMAAKKSQGFAHMAGDMIERLGEFVQRAGATEWGQKIYRYGNRLEHMDKKAQRK